MNKNFLLDLRLFIFLIIIFLIEGFFRHFYYFISANLTFLTFRNISGHNEIIWDENGIIETIQVIFLFLSLIYFFLFLKNNKIKKSAILHFVLLTYFVGILYFFLEEISWGQHIFKWDSPSFFLNINKQSETNLHNISTIFNQLPRNLLIIWCGFSFLLIKFTFLNNSNFFKNFIYPDQNLKKISILVLVFFLPDFIIGKLDLFPGQNAVDSFDIKLAMILDIFTFNFVRLSELHELIFCYYILNHSYYLKKNLI